MKYIIVIVGMSFLRSTLAQTIEETLMTSKTELTESTTTFTKLKGFPPIIESNRWTSGNLNSTNGSVPSSLEINTSRKVVLEYITAQNNATPEYRLEESESISNMNDRNDSGGFTEQVFATHEDDVRNLNVSESYANINVRSSESKRQDASESTYSEQTEEVNEAGKEYNTTNLGDGNTSPSLELQNATQDEIKVTALESTKFFQNHTEVYEVTESTFPESAFESTSVSVKGVPFSLLPNENEKDSSNGTQNPLKNFSDLFVSTPLSTEITSNTDNGIRFKHEYDYFNSSDDSREKLTLESSESGETIFPITNEHYKTHENVSLTTITAVSNDTESDDSGKLQFETSKLHEATEGMAREERNYGKQKAEVESISSEIFNTTKETDVLTSDSPTGFNQDFTEWVDKSTRSTLADAILRVDPFSVQMHPSTLPSATESDSTHISDISEDLPFVSTTFSNTEATRNTHEHTKSSAENDPVPDVNPTDLKALLSSLKSAFNLSDETIASFTRPSAIWTDRHHEQNSTAHHNLTNSDVRSTETSAVDNSTTKPKSTVEGKLLNCYLISGVIFLSIPLIIVMCLVLIRRKQRHSIDISEIPHLNLRMDDYKLTPIPRISTISNSKTGDPILSHHYLLEKPENASRDPMGYSLERQAFRNSRLLNESGCEFGSDDRIPRLKQPYMSKNMSQDNLAYIN